MNRAARIALGVALVAAGGAATGWLSHAPYSAGGSGGGVLRLTWSARPERIEHCRRLTDAELENVPAHMRQRVKCEGRAATYRLVLAVGGVERYRDVLEGGGARGDRPLHVLEDIPLPPGRHSIELSVMRIDSVVPGGGPDSTDAGQDTGGVAGREARETAERARARREALPPELRLARDLTLGPGEVALVTYDPDARRLVLMQRAPR